MQSNVPSQSVPISVPISDLEASFQMPKAFSNEIEIRDGEKTIVYVARAFNLRLDGLDIYGNLSLTKYEVERVPEQRMTGWFSKLFFEIFGKEVRRQIWYIRSGFCGYGILGENLITEALIMNGKPASDKNYAANCEWSLVKEGIKAGIILSDKLLDLALTPIYEKLMEVYRTVRDLRNLSGHGSN
jgi:hypothetical protein